MPCGAPVYIVVDTVTQFTRFSLLPAFLRRRDSRSLLHKERPVEGVAYPCDPVYIRRAGGLLDKAELGVAACLYSGTQQVSRVERRRKLEQQPSLWLNSRGGGDGFSQRAKTSESRIAP